MLENHMTVAKSIKLDVLRQAFETLEYLHSVGIIHRDIKFDNLMIERETLKLRFIDFGFAE